MGSMDNGRYGLNVPNLATLDQPHAQENVIARLPNTVEKFARVHHWIQERVTRSLAQVSY